MLESAIVRSRRQKEGEESDVDGDKKSDNVENMAGKLYAQLGFRTMFSFFLKLVGWWMSGRCFVALCDFILRGSDVAR